MAKAGKAASSARSLLELGDTDGVANRAYDAMFDAARAALQADIFVAAMRNASQRIHPY
jgi:uncharacterized protein (UPF0332 family)